LRFPSAKKIETFANQRLELVEIKLKPESVLNGVALFDMSKKFKVKVLICAVQRDGGVFIPTGEYVFQAGDKISVVAAPNELEAFFKMLGIMRQRIHNVILVGGSRIAYYLSKMLINVGVQVKIIDKDKERCLELCELLPEAIIINGDGTDHELLQEEGIDSIDALIALTGYDEENIIMSLYAISRQVDKVITKVNRMELMGIIETLGLDSVISPREVVANLIISYVRSMQNTLGSNVETMRKIAGGQAEALEFRVKASSLLIDVPLKDLKLKQNLIVACIVRGNDVIIPGGNDSILTGDRVIVITTNKKLRDLSEILL